MLLLSRRIGEEILIADGKIKITVVGIKGSQVRIGIEAPKDVDVHRAEVYERILQEREKLKEQEEVIK